jgi:hypothetical protein
MDISHRLTPPPGWPLWRWIVESRFRPRAETAPRTDIDDGDLADLDSRTLRDIGASPQLLARAQARNDARCDERHALRLGAAAAGWRHW